jgi:general secretion pathway protein J
MRRPGGFTLLELLVALAVMGMIALMLAGTTQYGIAAWRRTDAFAATAGELLLGRTILARDLARAYPEWRIEGDGSPRVAFDGTADSMRFLAPAPDSMGGAGLARFSLAVGGDHGDRFLALAAGLELGTGETAPASVLLDRAVRIEFAYYGPPAPGAAPSWQEEWRARAELPMLVRVRVVLPPGDARHWPELIVRPSIAVDAGCVYDPLSYHCRGR